jgi:hypothetical protein
MRGGGVLAFLLQQTTSYFFIGICVKTLLTSDYQERTLLAILKLISLQDGLFSTIRINDLPGLHLCGGNLNNRYLAPEPYHLRN